MSIWFGVRPYDGIFVTPSCKISMWCVTFTADLFCLTSTDSNVFNSGLSLLIASGLGNVVVDVAVARKCTLFFCSKELGISN